MKRSVKILLLAIVVIALLIIILQFFSDTKIDMANKVTGFALQKNEGIEEEQIDLIFEEVLAYINKEGKYLDFIKASEYHSAEVIISKESYYFEYDEEENEIVQLQEEGEMDFTMKISKKRIRKIVGLYEEKSYQEAVMYLVGELPRKVKVNLFRQCMDTEWCKQFNF